MSIKRVTIDTKDLEAPRPLIMGIKAIKNLKPDEELIFIHRMFPCKLLDIIKEHNLQYKILENRENYFKMRIYH